MKIVVRAKPGLLVPIHPSDYPHSGAQFYLTSEMDPIEVERSSMIVRHLRDEDLIEVTAADAKAHRDARDAQAKADEAVTLAVRADPKSAAMKLEAHAATSKPRTANTPAFVMPPPASPK